MRSQQGAVDLNVAQANFDAFSNALQDLHVVTAVTGSTVVPGQFGVNPYRRLGQPASAVPYSRSIFVGPNFSKTYGLEFLSGVPFANEMKEEDVVIINESAAEAFGFASPAEAIDQKLVSGDKQLTIVGVVTNFNWHSLKERHVPYVIGLTNITMTPYISVRMNTSDMTTSLLRLNPNFTPFTRNCLLIISLPKKHSTINIRRKYSLGRCSCLSLLWPSSLHVSDSSRSFPFRPPYE